ncbi:MAG: hypothetical protein NC098_07075 [Lachnoclostridium sp.]|nr:hypothetical protein [Lachnoclostridium sp.]
MKKSLLFAAAALAAISSNAETYKYTFAYDDPNMPFLGMLNNEESEYYFPGNYDFIDKYGVALPNTVGFKVINTPEGAEKGVVDTGVVISMLDGGLYKLPDAVIGSDPDALELMPEENYKYPFLSWGDKGMTRTILMAGWGTEDEWADANYNAVDAENWVACKNGVQFTRLGTDGIVSRQDTYFQYPAVSGNVTVTVWAGCNLGGNSNPDNQLKVIVTPVFDGVADAEQAVEITKDSPADKRYYKLDPVTFDANGKNLAVRVGCNGALLNLMCVEIEASAEAGIENIIVDEAANADAPVYNVLGQRVSDSYKGLVIKNGKKYIQK